MLLRLKFNLILLGIFVLSTLGAGLYYQHTLEREALNDVRRSSDILMSTAMAIRDYTTQQVKPHLDQLNNPRFLPQTVPAFAATDTLRRLNERFPGYEYREAVLNPTNPRDRANALEENLISQFRSKPTQTELHGVYGEGLQQTHYVARAIRITQGQCLNCHGSPSTAPASMLTMYGDQQGFGWKMNEIVGVQLVKIPMLYPLEKSRQSFNHFMASLLAIFGLMFIGLNIGLSLFVIEPVTRTHARLEDLATKDFLTDLVNRRRFFERLESEMSQARIKKLPLSIIILDLDFFKRINDTFGHDSGDMVLKNTALRVRELLRNSDCAARFGGEEFIILLRETPIDMALAIAEAVRVKIADVPFDQVGAVSASFGVAEWNHEEDGKALINRADKALYIAKHTGRNRVVRASNEPASRELR